MAGPAQRGVHEHGTLSGQGGHEQGADTVGEHRYVLGPVHASPSLRFLLFCGSCFSACLRCLVLLLSCGRLLCPSAGPIRSRCRLAPGK